MQVGECAGCTIVERPYGNVGNLGKTASGERLVLAFATKNHGLAVLHGIGINFSLNLAL